MQVPDLVSELTLKAVESLFRNARAIPEEKLAWTPSESTRSALDQVQECAQFPKYLAQVLRGETLEFTPVLFMQAAKEREEWTTLDECERICQFNTGLFLEEIKRHDQSRLSENVLTPWGATLSISELMMTHYWNMVWHTGQIAFIQRMLGDKEMH